MKRFSLLTASIALILSGCGGESSEGPPQTGIPVAPSLNITSSASVSATEDITYQYQLVTDYSDSVTFSSSTLPTGMTLSDDGLLEWTPLESVLTSGQVTVTVTADSDASLTDSQSFTIQVTPVNDSPIATGSVQLRTNEDTPLTVSHNQLLANVTDVDSPNLTISNIVASDPAISVAIASDSITISTQQDFNGDVDLSFNVSDGEFTIPNTSNLSIIAVNDPVVLTPVQDLSVEAGESLSYQVQVSDPDDENNGSDIQYSLLNAPSGLAISATGLLSFSSSALASTEHTAITLNVQDGLEDSATIATSTFELSELFYYGVQGQISSYYGNSPIDNGQVTLANNGRVLTQGTTAIDGRYTLKVLDRELSVSDPIVISADAVGYSGASESKQFDELSSDIDLYLPTIHASVNFDSQTPSDLSVDNEVLVSVEAQSFVDAQGQPVTGPITSELFIIDPSLDIDLMPGEMVTETPTGDIVPIESFGAITATFADSNGNDLQLAQGKTAQIRIPASGINPPATIPLFYYDEIQGIWVEEGTATLENGFYVGEVSHFTTWNADRIYDIVYVDGCVVDKDNLPINNARIRSEGIDYNGRSSAYTDEQGEFSVPVRPNSTVLISAENRYQSRTETVYSQSDNIRLSNCLTLDDATIKVQLTWGESPYDLDTHFYGPDGSGGQFHVYFGDKDFNQSGNNIFLDVDDTNSYGPEVVTIPDFTVPGTYRYSIYRYSISGEIQRTETKVELTLNSERTVFIPPLGATKRWWHVFEIEVSDNLTYTVTDISQWSDSEELSNDIAPLSTRFSDQTSIEASIAEVLLKGKYYAK